MQIKDRCWRYETVEGTYFVKYYEDEWQQNKLHTLHERLTANEFQYSVPITSSKTSPYIVQRWIEGDAADFSQQQHRSLTLHMLEALHDLTANWEVPYLVEQNLYAKWRARLTRFQEQEKLLRPLLGEDFARILSRGRTALQYIEPNKERNLSVLHGDVVHHNFLLGERPVLIDFDLACKGDPAEEVILWMHRVLPHIQFNVKKLVNEQPYTKIARTKLHYLRYPNELLREWLYLLQVEPKQRPPLQDYLTQLTKETLTHYPKMDAQIDEIMG